MMMARRYFPVPRRLHTQRDPLTGVGFRAGKDSGAPCRRRRGSLMVTRPFRLGRSSSDLARAPLVQHPTVPLRRPPGTAITGRHRNGGNRRRRGRSIEEARHGIGRTHPLLDHSHHLDDPRRVAHPGTHLVTGRHHRRRLRQPIVDPHMPSPARPGGIRPGLRQPDRPQPPIYAGRLHNTPSWTADRREVWRLGRVHRQ